VRPLTVELPRRLAPIVDSANPHWVEKILDAEVRRALAAIGGSPPSIEELGIVAERDHSIE